MKLKERPELKQDAKPYKAYQQFHNLLSTIEGKPLNPEVKSRIKEGIEAINAFSGSEKELKKIIAKTQNRFISLLEKEHKIVPKNHYRNMWLAVGMAAFGIPLGVAFSTSLGNMSYLALGLPIGMGIGIAVGTNMDKKALKEGRQLDIEIKM